MHDINAIFTYFFVFHPQDVDFVDPSSGRSSIPTLSITTTGGAWINCSIDQSIDLYTQCLSRRLSLIYGIDGGRDSIQYDGMVP
jgi:hypothetical protein